MPQRFQQSGYLGTTAGDPRDVQWSTGGAPNKEMIVGASDVGVSWFRVAARIRVTSGSAFTPVVTNDINGDGLANDRAFIFNPRLVADPSLANSLDQLELRSTAPIRACLRQQYEQIAAVNSCRTGWTAQVDVAVNATPRDGLGLGRRWRLTATVVNASSALVRVLGLENSALGRSALASPDPRLLQVIGFDQQTGRYRYRANQQFGRPVAEGAFAQRPPFEVHIGIQVPLDRPRNIIRSLPKRAGAIDSTDVARVRQELVARFVWHEPIDAVILRRDTLRLSDEQVASIRSVADSYRARRDSIIAPLVAYALSNPEDADSEEFNARVRATDSMLRPEYDRARQQALSFLTFEQRALYATLPKP